MPLTLQGLSTFVSCDDQELEQYDVHTEDKTISCYIPSQAGKNFEIHIKTNQPDHMCAYFLYIDGRERESGIVGLSKAEACSAGVYTSLDVYHPYQFSSLLVTDDEAIADPNAFNKDLGSIQVQLRRVSSAQKMIEKNVLIPKVGPPLGPIHEMSKKAGAHCTTLGTTPITGPSREYYTCDFLDEVDDPYAVYVFQYRSKDFLQAQGIIPPSPAPKPTSGSSSSTARVTSSRKRPSDSNSVAGPSSLPKRPRKCTTSRDEDIKPDPDSDHDLAALKEQLKQLQQKIEEKEANAGNISRIKREASPIRAQFTPGEVIDLT